MTLEELEAKLDTISDTTEEAERKALIVDLKVDMRAYKEERDKTEEDNLSRIEALENDIEERDNRINELKDSNTKLVEKYGKALLDIDNDKNESEEVETADELDDLIKKY